MTKFKVLVSAYACEPDKGSEQGVGWNWAKQIARFHEVWVITRANNRMAIENELAMRPEPNLHFIYYDIPKSIAFWKRKEKGLFLYYVLWQIGAFRLARKANKLFGYDLVHHITFGNIWLPTFMSFLSIPFIWGPVGGGDEIPKAFSRRYPLGFRFKELVRTLVLITLKINPLFLYTCWKASAIVVRTDETFNKIPLACRYKTAKIIETGVKTIGLSPPVVEGRREDMIQILSVGRLIPLKEFELGLRAFAKVARRSQNDMRLIIIGDGPLKRRLLQVCKEESISNRARLVGQLPREEVLKKMNESSIFLFPSIKEGGAWVIFEAMQRGLPVICLDIAGPGEIVTDCCGIKITPTTPDATMNNLANAIEKLILNKNLRRNMGQAAIERINNHFDWDHKAKLLNKIYSEISK